MKDLSIVIITGLSGSGKTVAINALEDAGFFCVDNMPVVLLPKFLELGAGSGSEIQRLALGMDLRERGFLTHYQEVFGSLRSQGFRVEIIYLESSEAVLVKRFSQTRRQHPVSTGRSLIENIRSEKEELLGLKRIADKVIDTSDLTVHQLKESILQYTSSMHRARRMHLTVLSFGFKYGNPPEADLLVDVRFLPNPYFEPSLKALDGRDERVKRFVKKWPETREFLGKYLALLNYLLPLYEKEGKSYVTIAVGCTGGHHRSVTIAEEIHAHLKDLHQEVSLTHRDIDLD